MAEELPQFDEKKTYLLSGKTLNQIMAAIKARTIVAVTGMDIERSPEGITLKWKKTTP